MVRVLELDVSGGGQLLYVLRQVRVREGWPSNMSPAIPNVVNTMYVLHRPFPDQSEDIRKPCHVVLM